MTKAHHAVAKRRNPCITLSSESIPRYPGLWKDKMRTPYYVRRDKFEVVGELVLMLFSLNLGRLIHTKPNFLADQHQQQQQLIDHSDPPSPMLCGAGHMLLGFVFFFCFCSCGSDIWCSHAKTRVVGHLLWNQEKWGNSTLVYHKLSNTYVCSVHTYV